MANQQEQKMLSEFVKWLPSNIGKFQGQIPDEIIKPIAEAKNEEEVVNVLNQLSQTEEGNTLVTGMFQAFQQETSKQTGMFKAGGKLAYGLQKFQQGGVTVKKRTDGVPGEAYSEILSNGTRKYRLTRNHRSSLGNTWADDTVLTITPQNDTLVNIGQIGMSDPGLSNLLGTDYHTKTDIALRKKYSPLKAKLFPWKPIPNNVLPAFRANGLIE